jgi:hypothetical protein
MTKPLVAERRELSAILRDMADRIDSGDSFEGNIEYSYWDEENGAGENQFSVMGTYRIGNKDGQGGLRMLMRFDV